MSRPKEIVVSFTEPQMFHLILISENALAGCDDPKIVLSAAGALRRLRKAQGSVR